MKRRTEAGRGLNRAIHKGRTISVSRHSLMNWGRGFLFSVLAIIIAALHAAAADCERGARYVITDVLNVRSRPVGGDVVNQVHKGDQVEVLECRGYWARIALSRWVHSGFLSADRPSSSAQSQASGKAGRFRELRDQAIRMLGWVAGNSYAHPVWPEMNPYVGRGGEYYDFFLGLSPPGLDRSAQEAEAFHNVSLYQKWFEKGQTLPFNEADNVNKIKRILQIAEEVVSVYR